ncbi:hypothetical protein [Sphingopyxis panaciterrae]
MTKGFIVGVALAAALLPGTAMAQEGAKLDCISTGADATLKASLGLAMTGDGDEASREALFKQLGIITDACVARHSITEEQKGSYFDYGLARISREYMIGDLARSNLAPGVVDKALDFGPRGANPDLSSEMTDDQVNRIVQAYIDAGIDIETIDEASWQKVGAYAAATSIYWNKRKALGF